MDVIRNQTQKEAESVYAIVPPTIQALLPVLEAHKEEILGVERRTFRYGATDRHQLDVYYPPAHTISNPAPILCWCYGGGFISGERVLPNTSGLVYATVGAFFARRGFLVAIPDYRLAPSVSYPSQAEDVRDALVWLTGNHLVISTAAVRADPTRLAAMGHSAGAINLATLFLHPALRPTAPPINALILHGAGYHFDKPVSPPHVIEGYWGALDERGKREPLGLLNAASPYILSAYPKLLLVSAEKEPSGIQSSTEEFVHSLDRRMQGVEGWEGAKTIVASGHNHISPNWVLGTGEGDEWGEEVAEWLNGVFSSTASAGPGGI